MTCTGLGRQMEYLAAIRRRPITKFYVIFMDTNYNAIEPFARIQPKTISINRAYRKGPRFALARTRIEQFG
jgi:outer membrane lipopolysaccharide assembly protein LptE/RlpB